LCSLINQLRQDDNAEAASTLADAERSYIIAALRETDWVVGGVDGAASKLGLPRTTLIAKMRKLGIVRERFSLRNGHPHMRDTYASTTFL
jgi:transcriptional regulator with GAF, ATPase, and Fis domain